MAIEGIDYSATAHYNSPSADVLHALGKRFIGRYAVNDKSPNGRGIHADEYRRMTEAGIDVFLYWEGAAAWMLGGWNAGVSAARNAHANILAAGMPADTPIYFAHDIDPEPKHFQAIRECVEGAASVVGWPRMGVYGGWLLIDHLAPIYDLMRYYCQTLAWAYGRGWHPKAQLQQYGFNAWIDGTNCDLVRAVAIDYGQALHAEPPPPPVNKYAVPVVPNWFAASVEQERPGDRSEGGTKYRVARRNYVAKVLTTRRSAPDPHARVSGPKIDVGEKVFGERVVQVRGQRGYWIMDRDGHYISGSKLSPKITIEPW